MEKVSKEYFKRFGYEYFGPLLYSFTYWLIENLKQNEIEKVYFLARDGYILKRAFDEINDTKICSYYLYASRRSIIVPSLANISKFNDIFELVSLPRKISIKSLLKKVGFEDFDSYSFKSNILEEYECDYIKNDEAIQNDFTGILSIIKENAKNELNCLKKYLAENEFYGKVAIVDVGWYGTMQKALNIIDENVEIFGYYLGLHPFGNYYDSEKSKGFLFDKTHHQDKCQELYSYRFVFEFLTLAHHGSVKKFTEDEVIFYDYEYENQDEKNISIRIQDSAIDYIKNNLLSDKHHNYDYKINEFFNHPKLIDAVMFGDLKYVDNDTCYMARPKAFFYYLLHPRKMLYDYKKSGWKLGFMKRLIKIPFPYYKINLYLRKKYSANGGKTNE